MEWCNNGIEGPCLTLSSAGAATLIRRQTLEAMADTGLAHGSGGQKSCTPATGF